MDQAIEFLEPLIEKFDNVEEFRLRVLQGNVDSVEEWLACMEEYRDPVDQLAALRQGMVQDAWSEVIKSNISDGLEQYPHMEKGEFDFKRPSAEIESGRCRAYGDLASSDYDNTNSMPGSQSAQRPTAMVKMAASVATVGTTSRCFTALIDLAMADYCTPYTL